jgi:hypothetical protein
MTQTLYAHVNKIKIKKKKKVVLAVRRTTGRKRKNGVEWEIKWKANPAQRLHYFSQISSGHVLLPPFQDKGWVTTFPDMAKHGLAPTLPNFQELLDCG